MTVANDRQQALVLLWAHHQRDLGGQIQAPERHAVQEPDPGHAAVAIADAHGELAVVLQSCPPGSEIGHHLGPRTRSGCNYAGCLPNTCRRVSP